MKIKLNMVYNSYLKKTNIIIKMEIDTYIKEICNNNISLEEYNQVLETNKHHFVALLEIVLQSGEKLEGDCFYYHESVNKITDCVNKQINLYTIGSIGGDILEIGFNAGNSTLLFLLANPKNRMYCFDICEHAYTKPCFEYLLKHFPNRLELYEGPSNNTISEYYSKNPNKRFDVIHIDGSHDIGMANIDYFHTRNLSKFKTILILDDTYILGLRLLFDGYVRDKHITEFQINKVKFCHAHALGLHLKNN